MYRGQILVTVQTAGSFLNESCTLRFPMYMPHEFTSKLWKASPFEKKKKKKDEIAHKAYFVPRELSCGLLSSSRLLLVFPLLWFVICYHAQRRSWCPQAWQQSQRTALSSRLELVFFLFFKWPKQHVSLWPTI